MNLKEAKQIIRLLAEEWDLGKSGSGAKGNVCAWIYLLEIISESEKIIIEKKDNKVIGICGYARWNSKKNLLRKKIALLLRKILINSPFIKNKEAMYKYMENYDYTPENLKDYFDGEISIIIVDEKYRGLGVGKKMIIQIFEYAKKDGMKNLQILTDESCNYKFYENIGCNKVYEKLIQNEEVDKLGNLPTEVGYIFEKKLN